MSKLSLVFMCVSLVMAEARWSCPTTAPRAIPDPATTTTKKPSPIYFSSADIATCPEFQKAFLDGRLVRPSTTYNCNIYLQPVIKVDVKKNFTSWSNGGEKGVNSNVRLYAGVIKAMGETKLPENNESYEAYSKKTDVFPNLMQYELCRIAGAYPEFRNLHLERWNAFSYGIGKTPHTKKFYDPRSYAPNNVSRIFYQVRARCSGFVVNFDLYLNHIISDDFPFLGCTNGIDAPKFEADEQAVKNYCPDRIVSYN